jgi:hypothetical protein
MENTVIAGFRGPYCTYSLPAEQVQVLATIRRAQALCAMTEIRLDFARATVHEKLRSTIKMMKLLKWNAPILHQHVRQAITEAATAETVDQLMGLKVPSAGKCTRNGPSAFPRSSALPDATAGPRLIPRTPILPIAIP